ncbi:glycosyltransferase WbuB [bacterium]|nr:glycosyltransferase WbuB [bacterium]
MAIQNSEDIKAILLNQSAGPLFMELAEDLSERLGSVLLITGSEIESDREGLMIKKGPAYNRRTIASRALSALLFLLYTLREVLAHKSTVPILAVSNPPLLPAVALLLRLIRRQPYMVLVYDIYPDIPRRLGVLSNRAVLKIWEFVNKYIFLYARNVITLGPHMARTLEEKYSAHGAGERITIIPTWVDTGTFAPKRKRDNFFARNNMQVDKLTVLYSGNIGLTHDISLLIDAAVCMRDDPRISFLIIGEGRDKTSLMEKAKVHDLKNVTFLPLQPEESMPYSLACADVSIVSIRDGIEGLMMPSKTYYAMAVGSAIIGLSRSQSDVAHVIQESRCGVNIEPNDLNGLVGAIRMLADNRSLLDQFKLAARRAACERYARCVLSPSFVNLFATFQSTEKGHDFGETAF